MIRYKLQTILILQFFTINLILAFDWPWNKCSRHQRWLASQGLDSHTCALLFDNEDCRDGKWE